MKTGLLKIFASVVLFSSFSSAHATVIDFDDIDASAGDVLLGNYQGYTWNNILGYTALDGFPGFNNGIVSPQNGAYSGGELGGAPATPIVGTLSSATAFDFLGAQLGAGYYDGLQLLIQGSLNGSVLYSQTVTVGTAGAALFNFAFNNIDTLSFSGTAGPGSSDPFQCGVFNCTQFTMDDLVLNASTGTPPASVPEPGSLPLIAIAFAAFAARRSRFRNI